MTSVDQFLDRQYDARTYNCLHFAREVWLAVSGVDIADRLTGLLEHGCPRSNYLRDFIRLKQLADPCLLFMRWRKSTPHIGVYIRGKVLHLREHTGVEYLPFEMATRNFDSVRFYV